MTKLKVFEAFSGYGSQSIALRNLGIDYEVVGISEIDKYAIEAYQATHKQTKNFGDISKINPKDLPRHDLFTYSFPCQDLSVSGKMNGLIRGKTRSGLLYECEKIIEYHKPKYLLLENVKNLVSSKFKPQFDEWLKYLQSLGYKNYWKILNAKDFGIPQNRERIFVVSILNPSDDYQFPKDIPLETCIADFLEENIDNKYYLTQTIQQSFKPNPIKTKNGIIKLGNSSKNEKSQAGTVIDTNGISMTICAGTHGYAIGHIYDKGLIRRYTPRECFRLMGMKDEDIDKIQKLGISNTQQYKLAGNSIVVNVLEVIFKNLLIT